MIWSVVLYGSETWTLRKEDSKRLGLSRCGYRVGWK